MEGTSREDHRMIVPGNHDLDDQNTRDDLVGMDLDLDLGQIFELTEAYRTEIVAVAEDIDAVVARYDLDLQAVESDDENSAGERPVTER